jgi:DsbC/DsbD-like thiol-disulfide interchange protein
MKKLLIATIVLLAAAAVQVSAQTVSGSISKGRVSKGRTAKGTVVLRIPKGLHVNSYRPDNKNLIPTKVTVTGSGVSAYGVTYPPGKKRKFSFSDKPLTVYEGKVYFGFKVKVPGKYRKRTIRVKAAVRYQACTDEVCYAPKTKTVWITARVR